MLRILHNTKIDFIRLWKQAAIGIALFVLPGLLWIAVSNFRYSIEFTSGTLMQLQFTQPPDVGAVRAALTEGGLGSAEIARLGSNEPREAMPTRKAPVAPKPSAHGSAKCSRSGLVPPPSPCWAARPSVRVSEAS
jgi:preprotein translocase subunit SecF